MDDLITPGPADYINYLIAVGDIQAARAWQDYQVRCGRAAALEGGLFCHAAPVAWQRGYVEALQDMEH